jgi:hypothetical protein
MGELERIPGIQPTFLRSLPSNGAEDRRRRNSHPASRRDHLELHEEEVETEEPTELEPAEPEGGLDICA